MELEDIKTENDLYIFIGTRFRYFKEMINKILQTNNIEFYGTEYDLPIYFGGRREWGGGRVDMLFGNKDMLIPIELKYKANSNSKKQLERYIELLKERSSKQINGILLCKHTTKSLREEYIEDNVYVIDLSEQKMYYRR